MEQPEFSRGDRVRLVKCPNGAIPAGSVGVVLHWNGNPVIRQLGVAWDGPIRRQNLLVLVPGRDEVEPE
ncbi:hypothetical protein [Streptacidiphilus sp. EB103A]|uniref:hypothetical protein n=1 Tax=Streptacidiphilus sp. EB103A TaxID=3156275 RepID=UPI0035189B3A